MSDRLGREMLRLEAVQAALWPQIIGPAEPSPEAAAAWTAAQDRKAVLLGWPR